MASTSPVKDCERERDLQMLKDELATQEALSETKRDQRKTIEEEKRRTDEGLQKSQANNDRLKEEIEKFL